MHEHPVERFLRNDTWNCHDLLTLRAGSPRDYASLAQFHYRANRPAAMTRILKLSHQNETVAILVESLPALSSKARNHAFNHRYQPDATQGLTPREAAKLLNAEMRCISRVVVHPQWRGLGLAVKLVKYALQTATTPFTESLAVMGHVNPFFERAGMHAYKRPTHQSDARLQAAFQTINLTEIQLANLHQCAQTILNLPTETSHWIQNELKRWSNPLMRTRATSSSSSPKEPGVQPLNKPCNHPSEHPEHPSPPTPPTPTTRQSRQSGESGGAGGSGGSKVPGGRLYEDLIHRLNLARQRLFFEPLYYLHAKAWLNKTQTRTKPEHQLSPVNPQITHNSAPPIAST